MSEEKKERKLIIELSDNEAMDFANICYKDSVTPGEILRQYIIDLIETYHGTSRTPRAEEAKSHYNLTLAELDREEKADDFATWLIKGYELETAAAIMEDLYISGKEIERIRERHPEEVERLATWKKSKTESEAALKEVYQRYTEETENPEDYNAAVESLKEYIETLEAITRGAYL